MNRKICVLLAVLCLTALCATALAACSSEKPNEESGASSPVSATEAESSLEKNENSLEGSESSADEKQPENINELIDANSGNAVKTASPVIIESKAVVNTRVIVSGTCESGAVIYCADSYDGRIVGTANSNCGTFIFETKVTRSNSPLNARFYALVPGKGVSEPAEKRLIYKNQEECPYQDFVWTGSDGWLFFTNTRDQFSNTEAVDPGTLNAVTNGIRRRVEDLAADGIKLMYVIIPNPNEIYPEYMPEGVRRGTVSKRAVLTEALKASGAHVIDIYDDLLAAKEQGEFELYHRTDSHWTEYAAYLAYSKMCECFVSDGFTGAAPREIGEFGFTNEVRAAGDLYFDLGLDEYAFKVTSTFSHISFPVPVNLPKYSADDRTRINDTCMEYMEFHNTDSANKPSFLMKRDSYSIMLFDWLAERCADSYYSKMWLFEYDKSELLNADVDYLIYFISEMNLMSILR